MLKYLKLIIPLLLISSSTILISQNKLDLSIGGIYSFVTKNTLGLSDEDAFFHYTFKHNYGGEIQLSYRIPIKRIKGLDISLGTGYKNLAYEGRHYEGQLEDPESQGRMLGQYFWSIYRLNYVNASIGLQYNTEIVSFSAGWTSNFFLRANEKRQEVWLSNFFNDDRYFKKENYNADPWYNPVFYGFDLGLDYHLFKRFSLFIKSHLGNSSITNWKQINLYYNLRSISIGFKYNII